MQDETAPGLLRNTLEEMKDSLLFVRVKGAKKVGALAPDFCNDSFVCGERKGLPDDSMGSPNLSL